MEPTRRLAALPELKPVCWVASDRSEASESLSLPHAEGSAAGAGGASGWVAAGRGAKSGCRSSCVGSNLCEKAGLCAEGCLSSQPALRAPHTALPYLSSSTTSKRVVQQLISVVMMKALPAGV